MIKQLSKTETPELKCGLNGVLRTLRESDITRAYVDGINSAEVQKFLLQPNMSRQNESSLQEYARENFNSPDAILLGLFVDGSHRGNIRLHNITADSAFLGIAIFDASIWGKGWGHRAIRVVSVFGTQCLHIKTILAGISEKNPASIRAFLKAGYKRKNNLNERLSKLEHTFWQFSQ